MYKFNIMPDMTEEEFFICVYEYEPWLLEGMIFNNGEWANRVDDDAND